jgi:hypothetical protein
MADTISCPPARNTRWASRKAVSGSRLVTPGRRIWSFAPEPERSEPQAEFRRATHVALLRGINVGGRNRVAMADLRAVVTSLAHSDVATYIQSGNVVFTSTQSDTAAVATALEQAIAESLNERPAVVVLSRDELSRVVEDNPYPDEIVPNGTMPGLDCRVVARTGGIPATTRSRRTTGKVARQDF